MNHQQTKPNFKTTKVDIDYKNKSISKLKPTGMSPHFTIIKNDHQRASFRRLIDLKCIISRQLPKMPKSYITKILFDEHHECVVLSPKKSQPLIGGVCFRCFKDKQFVEVVFMAVDNEFKQKGLGTKIMNYLKQELKSRGKKLILTYADNTAIGFFKKQGFEPTVETLDCDWSGYIKIYLEGTLMQCKIIDGIQYTKFKQKLGDYKTKIHAKVKSLPIFKYKGSLLEKIKTATNTQIIQDVNMIPGVLGSFWSAQEEFNLQLTPQYSLILQRLFAVTELRKIPQSYLLRGIFKLPLQSNTDFEALETWGSIEKRIISCRQYKSQADLCNHITEIVQQYSSKIAESTKQGKILHQLSVKMNPILEGLRRRCISVLIQPLRKQGKMKKSSNA